jgi:hypothetical protein
VENIMERLAVSKQATQQFNPERLNLKKINDLQDASQINGHNLNNVRREPVRNFRKKVGVSERQN